MVCRKIEFKDECLMSLCAPFVRRQDSCSDFRQTLCSSLCDLIPEAESRFKIRTLHTANVKPLLKIFPTEGVAEVKEHEQRVPA